MLSAVRERVTHEFPISHVTVQLETPAMREAEVHGHDTNTGIPVITGDGWKFRFRDVLPRGHVAVVDTAAAVVTIDGEPTLTGLTADSRIRAVLPPGRSEVRVTGADRAVVWWRRGYPSI